MELTWHRKLPLVCTASPHCLSVQVSLTMSIFDSHGCPLNRSSPISTIPAAETPVKMPRQAKSEGKGRTSGDISRIRCSAGRTSSLMLPQELQSTRIKSFLFQPVSMGLRNCPVQSCPIVCKLNSSSENPTWILEREGSGREMKEHVCKTDKKANPSCLPYQPFLFLWQEHVILCRNSKGWSDCCHI